MGLQHQNKVVGGVDKPRFLIVGPELSPNISFEENANGWSGSADVVRGFDSGTPFGDYVVTIQDDNGGAVETATFTVPVGEPIGGLKYIVQFYARNDASQFDQLFHVNFTQASGGTASWDFSADQVWRAYTCEVIVASGLTGTDLTIDFNLGSSGQGAAATGIIRVDQVRVRKIFKDFALPVPERGNQRDGFRQENQAQHTLITGRVKSYLHGYRYFYEAKYDRLAAGDEQNRRELLAAIGKDLVLFPHQDAATAYFVQWSDDFQSEWAYGVAPLGHQANLSFESIDLIPASTDSVVDPASQYVPPTGPFAMGEGFFYG